MPPRLPVCLRALLVCLVLPLLGCNSWGLPRKWGPLRLADDNRCPQVYGSYDASDADLAHIVVARQLPDDEARRRVESMSLVLHDDSVLTVIAWADRTPRDTFTFRRGTHFDCADGWLQPVYPAWLPSYDVDTLQAKKYHWGRNYVRIATNRAGALVARIDHHTFDHVSMWSSGGAYLPVPWTWRITRIWHRAVVVNPQTHAVRAEPRPITDLDERLMREEAILDGTYGTEHDVFRNARRGAK